MILRLLLSLLQGTTGTSGMDEPIGLIWVELGDKGQDLTIGLILIWGALMDPLV